MIFKIKIYWIELAAERGISELKNTAKETIQTEAREKKKDKKTELSRERYRSTL